MKTVWFDHGLSCVADAITMINEDRLPGLRILASHRDTQAPALHLADVAFSEPVFDYTTDSGIRTCVDWCLQVCRQHQVDIYAVQGKQRTLAPHVAQFEAIGTRLLLNADADTLELIDDKARFFSAALAADLPMPWTVEVNDVTGFDAALAQIHDRGLRVCIKPPRGIFGAGYWQLDDTLTTFRALMRPDDRRMPTRVIRTALEEACESLDAGACPALRLLVLEFLQGPEWSIDCLCENGALHMAVGRLKLERAQRLAVSGPAIELAKQTVAAFNLSGLINVQLRAAGQGVEEDLRVLEVNTRMSGGCLYTRASGVNLPWWHLALACGLRSPNQLTEPVGEGLVASRTVAMVI